VLEVSDSDGEGGGGERHDAEGEHHRQKALGPRGFIPQETLPVPYPRHRLRAGVQMGVEGGVSFFFYFFLAAFNT
jgi:hypothetical protein